MEKEEKNEQKPEDFSVITVIPISRSGFKSSLSYFSPIPVEIGSVLNVSMRGKKIPALITDCVSAREAKTLIKTNDFELKKIEKPEINFSLPKGFIEAVKETSDWHASPFGQTLSALLPKQTLAVLENEKMSIEKTEETCKKELTGDLVIIQTDDEDRIAHYRSIIREEFARKSSLLVVLPTIEDVKYFVQSLEKGVISYTSVFHSRLTKKRFSEEWTRAKEESHPMLLVATPSFLVLPRNDIKTVIVERESSRAWTPKNEPFIDYRFFIENFFGKKGAKIIFGDRLLRIDTLYRYKKGEISELVPSKWRPLVSATTTKIDMRNKKTDTPVFDKKDEPKFKIISEELSELIKYTKEKNARLFLYTTRRGLAPNTVCADCGTVVSCANCKSPLVLHVENIAETGAKNYYLCHKCGERIETENKCLLCGGWRLFPLGIGADKIADEIKTIHPDINLFRLDKDLIKTPKGAEEVVKKFYNSPGSILLGTEMAIYYLRQKVEHTGIVSLDSLLSIPDFRIRERIMNIILSVRELANEHFLLQTRKPDDQIFEFAVKGNLTDFYKEEIEGRKHFDYPPFAVLIKTAVAGGPKSVALALEWFREEFKEWTPHLFRSPAKIKNGGIIGNTLIRLSREKWPNKNLLAKLRSLPKEWLIQIDPENLL